MRRFFIGVLLLSAGAFALAQDDQSTSNADDAAANDTTADAERDALEPAVSSAALAGATQAASGGERVMDELDLGRTEITGNQELPKVLYIVPWQKSDPGDLMGRPVNTLLDEVLAPIDRGEFVRQIRYYGELKNGQEGPARE